MQSGEEKKSDDHRLKIKKLPLWMPLYEEGVKMIKDQKNGYTLIRDDDGNNILCPIHGEASTDIKDVDNREECFDESVTGRYAGNIKIRPS